MARAKLVEGNSLRFHCPGCGHSHIAVVTGPSAWGWNGDCELPTLTPSVLVYSHKRLIDHDLEGDALTAESNITSTPRCHSYVRDGLIEYLSDSTHALAGQTVALPDLGSDIRDVD